ncbi:WD40-repeat-containing domain protein [Lactifluus subvellereus]|nr:WD40-repeat-containing domain protein [Lactifluus subvellereus]
MLAILTTGHITIAEHSVLRRGPPTLPPSRQAPLSEYVASVWSPDNGSLYVATTGSVTRYDTFCTFVKSLWPLPGSDAPVDNIGNTVYILEHSSSASSSTKIVQTLPVHPGSDPVHTLSLSHDGTLLAAASASAVIVHNLALGTRTTLRGLPGRVAVCTFHVHSRVRLLLGIGHNLVIYDITRASGPSRIASIGDGTEGDVVAVACSPYSRTLLAVACSGGYVVLVDLDRELSLIRSFHFEASVTSLLFSADGASLYVGTQGGKLLVQTLRSTEAPRVIAVGEQGCRVEGLAIVKKSKLSVDSNSRTTGSTNNKPLIQHDINSPLRSSTSKRVNSATALGSRGIVSSVRGMFANESAGVSRAADPARPAVGNKGHATERTTTPPLSPPALTTPISKCPSRPSIRSKPVNPGSSTTLSVPGSKVRERTLSGSTQTTDISETKTTGLTATRTSPRTRTTSASKSTTNLSPASPAARQRTKAPTSPRATSVSSRRAPAATTRVTTTPRARGSARDVARQRTTSGVSRASTTRTRSPMPPIPRIPPPTLSTSTRMPSPEPSMPLRDTAPPFPIKQEKPRKKGLSMLGLATPEVERWIAGKGDDKGSAVEFPVDSSDEDEAEDAIQLRRSRMMEELTGQENGRGSPRLRTLSVQITPRKAAWAASPLRHSIAEGSPGMKGVTGLLHALISDAMLDFRQETRAEMVGLHLDLVHMGRAWRREMRATMQEYVGDLKELREENRKLREENERLRRGY